MSALPDGFTISFWCVHHLTLTVKTDSGVKVKTSLTVNPTGRCDKPCRNMFTYKTKDETTRTGQSELLSQPARGFNGISLELTRSLSVWILNGSVRGEFPARVRVSRHLRTLIRSVGHL